MKFKSLINFLDTAFPKKLSSEWDNDGVEICTDMNLEVGRILLTLDITFEALDYALMHGYNCIISHHPMIFSPMKKLDLSTSSSRKAVFLAKHGICAVSLHTRLDAVSGGVNDCLLDIIGVSVEDAEPFGAEGLEIAGRIFSYSPSILTDTSTDTSSVSAKDFAGHIKRTLEEFYKEKFNASVPVPIKYIEGDRPVQKVAVVSGSGMDFVGEAINLGVDTFLTGESSYHKMIDAYEFNPKGERINIIAAGHFETEALVLPYLKGIILEKFSRAHIDIHAVSNEKFM